MFWRMTGLSATSPVDAILDKENYTLDELLDEDDIIQECKALNTRLINFLREKAQVEQLLRLIVEEVTEDAEKKRVFKFPFIACEIFTCEVDIILRTLVEDEELINLLFSFLKPDRSHSPLQAGYFSKVVVCLMLRKTLPLINYVQKHPEIVNQLVDLIGITSIMEVLIRLIGADETMYTNYADAMQWLDDTNVLEMIVEKFGSSDSPEVHANAAEVLCAVTRYAPPNLGSKICSPSFVGRLFHHAFEPSRPRSVLVHSLSVCISLLDPKRLVTSSYQAFRSQLSHGTLVTASPETVSGMLESLGELLKLLDISSAETPLPTTYGILQPPLGKHRLKIVEFISVLLSIGSEAAEAKLVNLGAIKRVIDLFFEYPYNNFLHHFVENIITSCLESRQALLIEHLLNECNLVGRILETENQPTLSVDSSKPTKPKEGRTPPKVGNIGHITRIANKLIQLANNNTTIQSHLQENNNWLEWQKDVLAKRNAIENVYQWACGRPTSLHDRGRDSDEEDFRDRDYDVAALASNLSQAFRYGIYTDNDIDEAQSAERDDEDPYFDDESAEVVISSLRLGGENQDSGSLFTNSNWFAFDDNAAVTDSSISSIPSPSPSSDDLTEEKAMIGETSETTTEPNRNRDLEASIEGDEEEDDDDGPTIVLGNGPIEPPSISAADRAGLNSSPMDIPSSVETDAAQAGEDVLPVKDEKDDVEIVEKEVIMETPVADTGTSEPNKEMERLVAETSTAEPKAEVEIPVAETVITEVKTEVETPVPEIGTSEPNKQKETLVAETGSAEPKGEAEIPVAETVVTKVKTEAEIPVAETGVTEPKTEESENVQK